MKRGGGSLLFVVVLQLELERSAATPKRPKSLSEHHEDQLTARGKIPPSLISTTLLSRSADTNLCHCDLVDYCDWILLLLVDYDICRDKQQR